MQLLILENLARRSHCLLGQVELNLQARRGNYSSWLLGFRGMTQEESRSVDHWNVGCIIGEHQGCWQLRRGEVALMQEAKACRYSVSVDRERRRPARNAVRSQDRPDPTSDDGQ